MTNKIIYNWDICPTTQRRNKMDRNTQNKNTYTFTEGGEKQPAGNIVNRLVKAFTTINPEISYEDALRVIQEIPENKKLFEVYVRDSSTLL